MFEQTIYTVLYAKYSTDGQSVEWKEEAVKELFIKDGQITKVTTADGVTIPIDGVTTFARRATGMFDKLGALLFGGDIVKVTVQHYDKKESKLGDAVEMLLPIVWINGAYCIPMDDAHKNEIVYLTQQNVMEMEKIGNVYQHGKILEKAVDEAIFETDADKSEGEATA